MHGSVLLVKGVADAALCLQLMPETLYLTCNIIDRYLEKRNITRKRLQLVSLCLPVICTASSIFRFSMLGLPVYGCPAEEMPVWFAGWSDRHAHRLQV